MRIQDVTLHLLEALLLRLLLLHELLALDSRLTRPSFEPGKVYIEQAHLDSLKGVEEILGLGLSHNAMVESQCLLRDLSVFDEL